MKWHQLIIGTLEDIAASLEMHQVGALLGLVAVMAANFYKAFNDIVKRVMIIIVQNEKPHIFISRIGFLSWFYFFNCLILVHLNQYFRPEITIMA
jgi:hypothetical protein